MNRGESFDTIEFSKGTYQSLMTKEEATAKAKKDLASRLGLDDSQIADSVSDTDFPDMALGAAAAGEMRLED